MVGRLHAWWIRQLLHPDLVCLHPRGVRTACGKFPFDLLVGNDATAHRVYEEHSTGCQAPLEQDFFRFDRQDSGFRSQKHQAAPGDQIPSRAKSVAVQLGADHPAVGEAHGGGTIPRLHERGVKLVETLDILRHRGVVIPGSRDQHLHHVRQAPTRQGQQLDGVVEAGGVAAARRDDGLELLDVFSEQRRGEDGSARVHPVDVAAQGVDLAVVADVAVRVRQVPGGKSIGREPLVH